MLTANTSCTESNYTFTYIGYFLYNGQMFSPEWHGKWHRKLSLLRNSMHFFFPRILNLCTFRHFRNEHLFEGRTWTNRSYLQWAMIRIRNRRFSNRISTNIPFSVYLYTRDVFYNVWRGCFSFLLPNEIFFVETGTHFLAGEREFPPRENCDSENWMCFLLTISKLKLFILETISETRAVYRKN